jgi:hypothetical protein
LKSGEGIISLARAFTMAGARSIVSSLWSVNDRSTPDIMSSFYQYLKAGLPKDVAMQKAKTAFIQSRGHADAHPFYWGSFICVGDMRPVSLVPGFSYVTWGIISAAGLILLIFLIKNINRLGTPRI